MMLGGMDTGGEGRGGEGRGEEGDRRKAESRSRQSERRDGLLGEAREELFMVNLHINDSSLCPYDFSASMPRARCDANSFGWSQKKPASAGLRMQTESSRVVACVQLLNLGQQIFCSDWEFARFWSQRWWHKPTGSSLGNLLTTKHTHAH